MPSSLSIVAIVLGANALGLSTFFALKERPVLSGERKEI
jgi:hypothetical protein